MTLSLGGRALAPGEKRTFLAPLGTRPDGTPIGLPLLAIQGARPGPVLGITAGIHGDEFEGPDTVRRIFQEIDTQQLSGSIIATPQANPAAFEVARRAGDADHLDLNRSFPGNPDGFLTARLAALIAREIVEQSSFLVDLHGGGLDYDLYPYVGFNSTLDDTGRASFELAKNFGISLLYGSTPFPNVLRLEAARRKIPAILVEAGGNGRLDEGTVALMRRGVENILQYLKMQPGESADLPDQYTLVQAPPEGEFRHFPTGGFVRNHARPGDRVARGQRLATVVDLYGAPLAEIDAHESGVILECRTLPVARTGDWSFAIALIRGAIARETSLDQALERVP